MYAKPRAPAFRCRRTSTNTVARIRCSNFSPRQRRRGIVTPDFSVSAATASPSNRNSRLIMLMNLLKQSLAAESVSDVHAWGQLILRVAVGLMIFPVAGLLTRLNAALLAGALSVAMLQNVLAWRDPQLAVLYALIMA